MEFWRWPLSEPKIVVYCDGHEKMAESVRNAECPIEIMAPTTREDLEEAMVSAEVIFGWKIPPHIYARASHLKWVQSMGAGIDDLVSNPHLSPSVIITRVTDQFGPAVAEYVFSELLANVRHVDRLRRQQNEGSWKPFGVQSLAGQNIGIAGLGSIGHEVVRKAKAFDMTVYGLSQTPHHDLVDHWFSSERWKDFVGPLDYLVVALPLTPKTRHIVDNNVFAHMRPGLTLVNIGRGEIINQDDLKGALLSHQISGAILDVFETEPLPHDDILWRLPNVRISPHIAGPSLDERAAQFFVTNVHKYLRHEPLLGLVNRFRGY